VTCLNETLFIQSFFAVTCLSFVWFVLYTTLPAQRSVTSVPDESSQMVCFSAHWLSDH